MGKSKKGEWTFPSNEHGIMNGIGEAGIETFKGNPYASLAREICQNSLDAKDPGRENPVIVQFACIDIEPKDIPDFKKLEKALRLCKEFWSDKGSKKTVDFFKKALKLTNQPTLSLLRISDFNTTGLEGSDAFYNTPWQNLVKSSGISNKGGSSGGSYGIGKSAPFACSGLRTVFYATKDTKGLEAFQGIARLVSFDQKNSKFFSSQSDNLTTGIGYCGETKNNMPIKICHSLDPSYTREKPGTDLFVLGFDGKDGWQDKIIISVLEDFLISFWQGKLEVVVADTVINAQTLETCIEQYREQSPKAYNYYQALISPEAVRITENFENLGKITLNILIENGFHRQVLMSRSNGMKIFDQKNISGIIQFAGICILEDEKINAYFREMENPQHDKWEPERHSKPGEAKKKKTALARFIRETVVEIGKKTTLEELDAEGVGEYLPDDFMDNHGRGNDDIPTKHMDISIKETKNIDDKPQKVDDLPRPYEDIASVIDDDTTVEAPTPVDDSKVISPIGQPRQVSFFSDEQRQRKTSKIPNQSLRSFLINADTNQYRIVFQPERAVTEGFLRIKMSGEQGLIDVEIKEAHFKGTPSPLPVQGNRIFLEALPSDHKTAVDVTIDYQQRCSLEVSLYAYQE